MCDGSARSVRGGGLVADKSLFKNGTPYDIMFAPHGIIDSGGNFHKITPSQYP